MPAIEKEKKVRKSKKTTLDLSKIDPIIGSEEQEEEEGKTLKFNPVEEIVSGIRPEQFKKDIWRQQLKSIVEGFYDQQLLRIRIGNTLCAQVYAKLGFLPGEKIKEVLTSHGVDIEKLSGKDIGKIQDKLRDTLLKHIFTEFKLRAQAAAEGTTRAEIDKHIEKLNGQYLISSDAEEALINQYLNCSAQERALEKKIAEILPNFPIYTHFLSKVRGCGTLMSAALLSRLDIHKAIRPSMFFKFIGLDPVDFTGNDRDGEWDNRARGKFEEHQIQREFINKEGNFDKKNSITYDPWLHTKVLGVLVACLMKQNTEASVGNVAYGKVYHDLRKRYDQEVWRDCKFIRGEDGEVIKILPNKTDGTQYTMDDFRNYPTRIKQIIENIPGWVRTRFKKNPSLTELAEYPKGRRFNAAKRGLAKAFIKDLWINWRIIEGLPCIPEGPGYEEARLGMNHHYRLVIGDEIIMARGPEPIQSAIQYWNQYFNRT